jgi:hypothetical protein
LDGVWSSVHQFLEGSAADRRDSLNKDWVDGTVCFRLFSDTEFAIHSRK